MKKLTANQKSLIKKLPAKYQIFAVILLLIIINFSYFMSFFDEYSLERVSDGDTIVVINKGEKIKIRLYGIDAPESTQSYGQYCKNQLINLLDGKKITLDIKNKDNYGRSVGIVYANNEDINAKMVQIGCAWAYQNYTKKYLDYEKIARNNKIGLWSEKNPQNPRDYRKEHK